MSKKNVARFVINFVDRTITGTKASFNKAGTGVGAIYEELAAKVAAHPDFELLVKEQKKRSNKPKRDYNGMDFPFMETYISIRSNSEELMAEYEAVKEMAAKCGTAIYPFTKSWFLKKFSTQENPFDMNAAREAINQFRMDLAAKQAAKVS